MRCFHNQYYSRVMAGLFVCIIGTTGTDIDGSAVACASSWVFGRLAPSVKGGAMHRQGGSMAECAQWCAEESECAVWTFERTAQSCILKTQEEVDYALAIELTGNIQVEDVSDTFHKYCNVGMDYMCNGGGQSCKTCPNKDTHSKGGAPSCVWLSLNVQSGPKNCGGDRTPYDPCTLLSDNPPDNAVLYSSSSRLPSQSSIAGAAPRPEGAVISSALGDAHEAVASTLEDGSNAMADASNDAAHLGSSYSVEDSSDADHDSHVADTGTDTNVDTATGTDTNVDTGAGTDTNVDTGTGTDTSVDGAVSTTTTSAAPSTAAGEEIPEEDVESSTAAVLGAIGGVACVGAAATGGVYYIVKTRALEEEEESGSSGNGSPTMGIAVQTSTSSHDQRLANGGFGVASIQSRHSDIEAGFLDFN